MYDLSYTVWVSKLSQVPYQIFLKPKYNRYCLQNMTQIPREWKKTTTPDLTSWKGTIQQVQLKEKLSQKIRNKRCTFEKKIDSG